MGHDFARRSLLCAAVVLAASLWSLTARAAQAIPRRPMVDLTLVLAVDASGSVSDDRFELQMQGYAAAFRNPKILAAIRAGGLQSIAVTMVQWTGPELHAPVVPWTVLKDQQSVAAFADAIASAPRELFGGGTSLSGAIDYGALAIATAPYDGTKKEIDISGDGSNNSGREAADARDDAVKQGIVINGLPILNVEPGLDQFYKENVIGGRGAFLIPVKNYDSFANAILRKLVAEISDSDPEGAKFAANR